MDWNARFQEAHALREKGEWTDASEIYEEVAEATMDPEAILATILSKNVLVIGDMGMFDSGIGNIDLALKDIDSTLKWIGIARQNDTLMSENADQIMGVYKDCLCYKGKLLYGKSLNDNNKLNYSELETVLQEAVNLGSNQARVYLALWHKDVAGALVDEGNPEKVDQISENYRKMTDVFEDYVNNYNPEEAESDEYRMACSILANQYQSGMVYPVDMEKAQRYEALAATFNEDTKTSNPSEYSQPTRSTNASSSSNQSGSGGGCYIATAVYGSYDCPEVWTLRRYRDEKLLQSVFGRVFVKLYYATSPTVVRLFGKEEWFNKFWRGRLNRMVRKLKAEGYNDSPYYDK